MLLLGVETVNAKTQAGVPVEMPPANIDSAYLATAPLPSGAPITISVSWMAPAGVRIIRRAESLIDNAQTHSPMSEGVWLYNGSFFTEDRFEAQSEKSFAAVVTDPAALINNPRSGYSNDDIWSASAGRLPEADTPVEFMIQLLATP